MHRPDQTRGLMTFLLAFSATAVIVAVAIGMLWVDKGEITSGFAKAKDISTVLIGVLGTILVLYFVSVSGAAPGEHRAPPPARVSSSPMPPASAPGAGPPAPVAQNVPPPAPSFPNRPAPELSAPVIPFIPSVASVSGRHHARP